jgi:medium-chain acyl-[acyl-carrier-protein] hydrolase
MHQCSGKASKYCPLCKVVQDAKALHRAQRAENSYKGNTMTGATPSHAWLMCPTPNPQARIRFFCFPYAGGGGLVFRTWAADLPPALEVYALRLPGRENRLMEPPFIRLTPLVETLTSVLQPYLDRPFAFFGHSMGALLCFELVHALRHQQGQSPVHLFISGRRAPQLAAPHPPIHNLPEAEFVEKLRRLNGTPEAVLRDAALMQVLLPTLRADFALCETYGYVTKEPLDCPISAFGGLQDTEARYDDLTAWRDQTRCAFTLRMLPGDHFFLHSSRTVLLQAISNDLAPRLGP